MKKCQPQLSYIKPVFVFLIALFITSAPLFSSHAKEIDELHSKQEKIPPEDMQKITAEARDAAIQAIIISRAESYRNVHALALIYPEITKTPLECYQLAVSNYVEDTWDRLVKEYGCSEGGACDNAPNGSLRKSIESNKRYDNYRNDQWYKNLLAEISTSEFIASKFYDIMRSVRNYLNPAITEKTTLTTEQQEVQITKINRYLSTCGTLQQLPWSTINADIPANAPTSSTAIKLGIYDQLIESLLASQFPKDKQGDVGCLWILNMHKSIYKNCGDDKKCIEPAPQDTKEDLERQMEELKAHQCSYSYSLKMALSKTTSTGKNH